MLDTYHNYIDWLWFETHHHRLPKFNDLYIAGARIGVDILNGG